MTKVHRSLRLRLILRLERFGLPLWRWALQKRLTTGKETQQSIAQKLMLQLPASHASVKAGTPIVWGHAVGVGEVLGLLGLFRRLSEHFPSHHFLLTSSSRTSGEALAKQNLPAHFHHQFAPVDQPEVMSRFLDAWRPRLACWSETDLWPCMVTATQQRGIPMLMLNTRIDPTKSMRLKRLSWFYLPLLRSFTCLYAQNASSAHHLSELGLADKRATVAGNIKALSPPLRADPDQLASCQATWRDRPIWLLASSHLGEEEIALRAHSLILQTQSKALLIIVPRDAFRGGEIVAASQAHGLSSSLRSKEASLDVHCQVYVADTMGELGLWYALSPVALIGGSLVAIGGHNPFEAIAAGCRVLSGAQVQNFSESYAELLGHELAETVYGDEDIARSVSAHWELPRLTKNSSPVAQALLEDILAHMR